MSEHSRLDFTDPYEIVPDCLYASVFVGPDTLLDEQPTRAQVQLTDRLNGSESKLTYKQATILHGWLTLYLTRYPWRSAAKRVTTCETCGKGVICICPAPRLPVITDAEIERANIEGEAAAAEAGERSTKRRGGA